MPHYDYLCEGCQHQFELFQPITAGAKRKCPQCGRFKLRRLIGPGAAIVFKGSGFYKTDYRSDSYRKGAEAEKSAASDGNSNGKAAGSKDKSTSNSAGKGGASES